MKVFLLKRILLSLFLCSILLKLGHAQFVLVSTWNNQRNCSGTASTIYATLSSCDNSSRYYSCGQSSLIEYACSTENCTYGCKGTVQNTSCITGLNNSVQTSCTNDNTVKFPSNFVFVSIWPSTTACTGSPSNVLAYKSGECVSNGDGQYYRMHCGYSSVVLTNCGGDSSCNNCSMTSALSTGYCFAAEEGSALWTCGSQRANLISKFFLLAITLLSSSFLLFL